MKFAIAFKGTKVSTGIVNCDGFLVYEEKCGKIIMRQIIENPGKESCFLVGFLRNFNIEALICNSLDEIVLKSAAENGIKVVTGINGNSDKIAEEFASVSFKKQANMKSCLQPVPHILVSCRGLNGENNVLAVAYCCNCSFAPPMIMVGIVPTRYSYKLIKESGCFVVNLVDKSYKDTFYYLGKHSKQDEDKLQIMDVKLEDGKIVNAPILSDCPVNIECSIVESIVTGSHEMFIGKVEYVHAQGSLIDDEGNIDFSRMNLL